MITLAAPLETFGFEIATLITQLILLLIIAVSFIVAIRRFGLAGALFNLAILTGLVCLYFGISRLNDTDSSNDIAGAILTVTTLVMWVVLGNLLWLRSRKES